MASDNSKPKPGPDEDRLQIDGDWEEALKKALQKKRPPEGWPEEDDEAEKSPLDKDE